MPRKPSESLAALQAKLQSSETAAAELRLQNGRLQAHVQLLTRELAGEEGELARMRAKQSARRRPRGTPIEGPRSVADAQQQSASQANPMRRAQSVKGAPMGSGDSLSELGQLEAGGGSSVKSSCASSCGSCPSSCAATPEPSLHAGADGSSFGSLLTDEPSLTAPTASPELSQGRAASFAPTAVKSSKVSPTTAAKLATGTLPPFTCPPIQRALAAAAPGGGGSGGQVDFDKTFVEGPRVEHGWTACPGRAFNVRAGPNYAKTGLKLPSLDALYDVVQCDAFSCPDGKAANLGRLLSLPRDDCRARHGVPANLVLTVLIPDYAPSLFGGRDDGPGWALVLCCRISADARRQLERGELSPALRLWRGVVAAPADSPLRKRLKCICALANPAEIGFDKVTASLVTKYNAKPFMCVKSGVYYAESAEYFGVEVDVHRWGKLALNGFNMVKAHIQHMQMRFGMLFEGVGDDEMPEQMLVSAYMSRLSSAACPQVPAGAPPPADARAPRPADARVPPPADAYASALEC